LIVSESRTELDHRSREPPTETLRSTWRVPDAVGTPEIVPVSELILSPAGSPLADHVQVPSPPVAVAAAI
jgi:hypothetical protein